MFFYILNIPTLQILTFFFLPVGMEIRYNLSLSFSPLYVLVSSQVNAEWSSRVEISCICTGEILFFHSFFLNLRYANVYVMITLHVQTVMNRHTGILLQAYTLRLERPSSDVGSKWRLLCSSLHPTKKHLNRLGDILVYTWSGVKTVTDCLHQGCQTQFLEGRSPAEFSSNPAPTHIPCSFQIVLNDLISWIRCV